jgi:hypothetical protein
VRHWGTSVDLGLPSIGPAGGTSFEPRIGLGYRAIDETMDMSNVWPGASSNRQDYHEHLKTTYVGLSVGIGGSTDVGHGLTLKYDAETGPYDLAIDLNKQKISYISALRIGLEKHVGKVVVSGFVRGEFYSYAPAVAYNQSQTGVFNYTGPNDGTSLKDSTARSVTVGIDVTVPVR